MNQFGFSIYRFYNCVNGVAYELPCATSLVFDEAEGTCVRREQASDFAKKCPERLEARKYIQTTFSNIIKIEINVKLQLSAYWIVLNKK